MKNKALFLDRDGVIVKVFFDKKTDSIRIVQAIDEVEFNYGIFNLIQTSHDLGFLNIVISNQSGLALKQTTSRKFTALKKYIHQTLINNEVILDGEYYCLHHPFALNTQYRKDCLCHKPKPGMLLQAAKDYHVDVAKSFFVGDGVYDIQAGQAVGCKTILLTNNIETGYLSAIYKELKDIKPDYVVKKLSDVVPIISSI